MPWVSANVDVTGLLALAGSVLAAQQARRARQAASRTEAKATTDDELRSLRDTVAKVNTSLGWLQASAGETGRELMGVTTRLSTQLAAHVDADHEAFAQTARHEIEMLTELAQHHERISGLEARVDRLEAGT